MSKPHVLYTERHLKLTLNKKKTGVFEYYGITVKIVFLVTGHLKSMITLPTKQRCTNLT